jgi:hypothetical protein
VWKEPLERHRPDRGPCATPTTAHVVEEPVFSHASPAGRKLVDEMTERYAFSNFFCNCAKSNAMQ